MTETVSGIVDLHSHLVPAVDDGSETVEMSLDAIARMGREGVTAILTTPHLDASTTLVPEAFERRMAELDQGWSAVRRAVDSVYPALDFRRGTELMIDVPIPDLSDPRIRLDGGRYLLMEWPRLQVPPASAAVVARIVEFGYVPVIAHPERYVGLDDRLDVVRGWRAAGALLQLNNGSLLGRYGGQIRTTALRLVRRGWVDFLSSDFHPHPGQEPLVARVRRFFLEVGAEEQWYTMAVTNPSRLLTGDSTMSVAPLPAAGTPGLWGRVRDLWSRTGS